MDDSQIELAMKADGVVAAFKSAAVPLVLARAAALGWTLKCTPTFVSQSGKAAEPRLDVTFTTTANLIVRRYIVSATESEIGDAILSMAAEIEPAR